MHEGVRDEIAAYEQRRVPGDLPAGVDGVTIALVAAERAEIMHDGAVVEKGVRIAEGWVGGVVLVGVPRDLAAGVDAGTVAGRSSEGAEVGDRIERGARRGECQKCRAEKNQGAAKHSTFSLQKTQRMIGAYGYRNQCHTHMIAD